MASEHYDYGWLTTLQSGGGTAWTPPAFPYSTGTVTLAPGATSATRTSSPGSAFFSSSTTGSPIPGDANIVGVELSMFTFPASLGLVAAFAEIVVGGVGLGDISGALAIVSGTAVFGGPSYLGGHAWVPGDVSTVTWGFRVRNDAGSSRFLGVDGVTLRIYTSDVMPPDAPAVRRPMTVFGSKAYVTR